MNEPFALEVDGSTQYLGVTVPFALQDNGAGNYTPAAAAEFTAQRTAALELLKRNGFKLDAVSRVWRLHGQREVLNFLAQHGDTLRKTFRTRFSPDFLQRTRNLTFAFIEAIATAARGRRDAGGKHTEWDLNVSISAAGAGDAAITSALAKGEFFVAGAGGRIALLPPQVLAGAEALVRRLSEKDHVIARTAAAVAPRTHRRVNIADLADIESTLNALAIPFQPPKEWQKRSSALRDMSRLSEVPCSSELKKQLRLYQKIGASWLWHLHRNRLGGVLADEMGLGKTIQTLALIAAVPTEINPSTGNGKPQPALVVCPASLVENWRREAARFTPQLCVRVHHGADRAQDVLAPVDGQVPRLVITSYNTLVRDIDFLQPLPWSTVIADEAQNIKNPRSLNARALRTLVAQSRFALTGTPVENRLDDLRSIFAFLLPGYLPPPATRSEHAVLNRSLNRAGANRFAGSYAERAFAGITGEDDSRRAEDLRLLEKAAPYILRRAKSAVAPELPAKIEQTLAVALEDVQETLYTEYRERARREISELEMSGASEAKTRFCAFTHLLRLRQICAEPRLLDDKLAAGNSAKFRALLEILEEAKEGGHRLLVFSQFAQVLRQLRADLEADGYKTCYLDGDTPTDRRQSECDRFNNDPSRIAFLISLKAGGTGLNLAAADIVVHYDPWWNPAVEAQAAARAHRIGQTRVVTDIRLVAANTVEERVIAMQHEKSALLNELFSLGETASTNIALADIKALLE